MCADFACMCMLVIGSVSRKGLCLSGTNTLYSQTSLLSAGDFDWGTILHMARGAKAK